MHDSTHDFEQIWNAAQGQRAGWVLPEGIVDSALLEVRRVLDAARRGDRRGGGDGADAEPPTRLDELLTRVSVRQRLAQLVALATQVAVDPLDINGRGAPGDTGLCAREFTLTARTLHERTADGRGSAVPAIGLAYVLVSSRLLLPVVEHPVPLSARLLLPVGAVIEGGTFDSDRPRIGEAHIAARGARTSAALSASNKLTEVS